MTQGNEMAGRRGRARPVPCPAEGPPARARWAARALAAVTVAVAAGCASVQPAEHRAPTPSPVPAASAAGSLVRVPAPDYASAASVAAAFYIAWASVDAVHDGPGTMAARCAALATPQLERQLAASQPATVIWDAMRRNRTVILVRVLAVTVPEGAPAPTRSLAYLSVYAERVTTTTAGRAAAPDGVTVELARSGSRWLAARVLFF